MSDWLIFVIMFIVGFCAKPLYYLFLLWRDARRYDKWRAAGGSHEDEKRRQ